MKSRTARWSGLAAFPDMLRFSLNPQSKNCGLVTCHQILRITACSRDTLRPSETHWTCARTSFTHQFVVSPLRHKAHGGSAHIEWSCPPKLAGAVPKGFSHCIPNNGRPESAGDWLDCH